MGTRCGSWMMVAIPWASRKTLLTAPNCKLSFRLVFPSVMYPLQIDLLVHLSMRRGLELVRALERMDGPGKVFWRSY